MQRTCCKNRKKEGEIRQTGKADCGKVFVNLSIARGRLQAAEIVNNTQRSGCELATHTRKYVANMHISIYQKPATHTCTHRHTDRKTNCATMPAAKAQLFPCATLCVLFMESLSWCFSMQMPYGKSVCVCVRGVCVWQTCIY